MTNMSKPPVAPVSADIYLHSQDGFMAGTSSLSTGKYNITVFCLCNISDHPQGTHLRNVRRNISCEVSAPTAS